MGSIVSIFIVLAALVTMVGVMYLVLTEKHVDESKINYVQSPYPQPPAKPVEKPVETPVVDKAADDVDAIKPGVTPESVEAAVTSVADSVDASAGQPTASTDENETTSGQPEA